MKLKHIILAVLVVVLPFVLVFGFGALAEFLHKTQMRTFYYYYAILKQLAIAIPLVAYMFWLFFIMRPKNRKARILLICCSMTVAVFFLIGNLCYMLIPYEISKGFASTTALICGLANLFAAIYMLSEGKKFEEVNE